MKRFGLLIVIFALLFMRAAHAQEDNLQIVATTTQAYDLLTILTEGVENVELTGLMGPGVDPHLYQPNEADISAMNTADLVVYSGLHLEGQFDTVFEALGERNIRVYPLAEPVEAQGFALDPVNAAMAQIATHDPHFWFDPRNWQLAAEEMASVLGEVDPANAETYQANYEAYSAQLDLLFNWALESMLLVPESQRYLVTSHDAFQYFGVAFGWQMRGLQGISTEDEAGVADIQTLAAFVVENQIPVMFIESSVPPDTIEAVQEAVGAQGFEVGIGIRPLFSDAMGEPGTFGGTYIGMIAENVYTILQSYQARGVEVEIPLYPADLTPQPSDELLNGA
jgi:manganese/zinc/iron transport system substrate-binding protein